MELEHRPSKTYYLSSNLSTDTMAAYRNGYNGADLKSVVSRNRHVGSNPTAVV